MRQLQAMKATIDIVLQRGSHWPCSHADDKDNPLSIAHFIDMYNRAADPANQYSDAKMGRHLGYIQGVLVAFDVLTLDEAKKINQEFA